MDFQKKKEKKYGFVADRSIFDDNTAGWATKSATLKYTLLMFTVSTGVSPSLIV